MKPPFAYYGGKTLMAERIAALLPDHGHYVEPFAGSLAVLLAKPRARIETVNDLDDHLVAFWRMVRDRLDDLERVAALTPHARGEFDAARNLDGLDDLERARRVWVLLSQSRMGTLRKSGWRFVAKPTVGMSVGGSLAAYVDRLPPVAARLHGVSIENRPALEVIADYGCHDDVVLYVDPPYDPEARNSLGYRIEMGERSQHQDLAEALHSCKANVLLSGYDSPLYRDLFGSWHRIDIPTRTGQGAGSTKEGDGDRVETLWANYPLHRNAQIDMFAAEGER